MHGGDQIAKILHGFGVKFLFTLCGGHISPILIGGKKSGIRVIDVRDEATAVFAADAVARLTGVPGVAAVTAGPGVTNTITAVKNAQMAQSPVVLLGGAVATVLKGRGALQDIDQISIMKSIVKWAVTIKQDCDIAPMMEKAFHVARSGIPGPVFVECPIDLLYDERLVREWYVKKSKGPGGIVGRITDWYLNHHVDHLYACNMDGLPEVKASIKSGDLRLKQAEAPAFSDKQISRAREILTKAQRPLMLLGSQVTLAPDRIPELVSAIENANVPVYLSGMARGLLGASHELQYRHQRTAALKEADVVLLAGVPLDFRLNYGRLINPKADLIAVNRERPTITKNRRPKLGVHADPAEFLIALARLDASSEKDGRLKDWKQALTRRELEREAHIAETAAQSTEFINPLDFCRQANTQLDPDSMIVADGGDFVATASYILHPRGPLSWLDPGPFGTLGVGAGFALGAKLVRPESEVWLYWGDGASGYGLMEFDTFVRHKLPVIAVIGNDAGWAQIARDQIEILGDDVATVLGRSDYHRVAEVFGGRGYLVERPEDIVSTLARAKADARNGTPVIINVLIGATEFRKGSISM